MKQIVKKKLLLSLLFFIGVFIFVTLPFFHKGFFPTMDDVQVVRTDMMLQELKSGQFPVRYVNAFGNGGGYFLFTFYPPFVYYLGALYHGVGISLVKTEKLVFLTGFALAGVSMYLLLSEFADTYLALVGSLLFLTSPFLSFEVYTRGTVAEFFGLAILPAAIWTFIRLRKNVTNLSILLAGGLFGLVMVVHTFDGICLGLSIALLLLLPPYAKRVKLGILGASLLGIGLSAFFWLPVLFEQSWTRYATSYFANVSYASNFLQILQSAGIQKVPWGFRPPVIGVVLFIGACISSFITLVKKERQVLFFFSLIGFLGSIFLASPFSTFLWSHIMFLHFLQFPWRFLAPATMFAVFLIILGLSKVKQKYLALGLGIVLLIFGLFLYKGYFRPTGYNFISQYFAEDDCTSTTWASEYLPIHTLQCLPKPKNHQMTRYPLVQSTVSVRNAKETANGRVISFKTSGPAAVAVVRRYYFPSWQAFVDDKRVSIFASGKYGLIGVRLPSGSHSVEVKLMGTFAETLGNSISLLTIGIALLLFVQYKRKKIYENSF